MGKLYNWQFLGKRSLLLTRQSPQSGNEQYLEKNMEQGTLAKGFHFSLVNHP
jgi:hypothetical protein